MNLPQPRVHLPHNLDQFLCRCRELSFLCTRNGWIDRNSLQYQILEHTDRFILLLVEFDELVMAASGGIAERTRCGGRVVVELDANGCIQQARPW